MKHLWAILTLSLFVVLPVEAQVVGVDTVTVTIVGDVPTGGVVIDSFVYAGEWRLNDTVPLVASWYDSQGDPVPGVLWTWGTDRPDLMAIYEDGSGAWFAVALGKGNPKLFVRGEAGQVMHLGFLEPDGSLNWEGGEVEVGGTGQFCAYLVTAENALVAESPGPPVCPMAFLPLSTPFDRVFANTTRSKSWRHLQRLSASLPGN